MGFVSHKGNLAGIAGFRSLGKQARDPRQTRVLQLVQSGHEVTREARLSLTQAKMA